MRSALCARHAHPVTPKCCTAPNLANVIESTGNSAHAPTPFCGRAQIRGPWCPYQPERVGVTDDTKGHTSHEDPPPQHPGHRRAELRPPRRRRTGRQRGHDVDQHRQLRELRHEHDIECRDVRLVDDTVVELELEHGKFRLRDHGFGILEFLDGLGHEFELRLDPELPRHGQPRGCAVGHTAVRLHSPVGLEQRVDVGLLTSPG